MLTSDDIIKAEKIFKHLEPGLLRAIQAYRPDEESRNYIAVAKSFKNNGMCESIHMNFDKFTAHQQKIFDKRSKKEFPGKAFIETHGNNVTRIGFK